MCFTKNKKHPTVKIANRTIVCYKRLEYNLTSPSMNFQYEYNKTYKLNSFASKPHVVGYYTSNQIEKGFHSYTNKNKADRNWYARKTFLCHIPKGAKYWYNPDNNEYCSNQLIIKREA